ncbi:MAG: hypothetical protein JXB44_09070 [Calditrichaceae bacterium]|nr:hypothetical protein [Calditrichaceae bacterium]
MIKATKLEIKPLKITGRSSNTANPGDLYKYSGKELDQEVMANGKNL